MSIYVHDFCMYKLRIAHLYIAGNLEKLDTVLSSEKNDVSVSSESQIGSSVWLIYVSKTVLESDDAVSQVFGNASFRLNSFTFLLFQDDMCKIFFLDLLERIVNIYKRLISIPRIRDKHLFVFMVDGNFEIRDIYKIDQFSNNIEIVSYGRWNRAHGISISDENIWIRRSNMKGHELR